MTVQLINADCVEAMAGMEPESLDSIVCDPPYEIGFMGRTWDQRGVAFNPNTWDAAYAVLKPGGYLLAFGGTRTYHRLACAIEDAGFELRDSIAWMYGSGFPKSMDVSKAIDKAAGAEREVIGQSTTVCEFIRSGAVCRGHGDGGQSQDNPTVHVPSTVPATPEAQQWQGWGTALKPAYEPIVVARKPLIGSVASNVLKYGTGGLNIDGCRVGDGSDKDDVRWYEWQRGESVLEEAKGMNTAGRVAPRPSAPQGRWPANIILSHVGGPNGCIKVGQSTAPGYQINRFTDGAKPFGNGAGHPYESTQQALQTVDIWECADGCPVKVLDEQAGSSISRAGVPRAGNNGTGWGMEHTGAEYDDAGGPSRYFNTFEPDFDPPFYYTAKASTAEREAGLSELEVKPFAQGTGAQNAIKNGAEYQGEYEGGATGPTAYNRIKRRANCHPTVKSLQLMRHLVRLVTPPGGTVLDPFMGSGSTGIAAIFEGTNFIGIEKDTEHGYMDIAKARIAYAEKRVVLGYTTFEDPAPVVAKSDTKAATVTTQIDMFEGLL